jgi:hypothetical protein
MNAHRLLALVLVPLLSFLPCGSSQAAPAPAAAPDGDQALAAYFRDEAQPLADRCLTEVSSLDQWQAHRQEYRQPLFEMLGLSPLPERTDLKAVVTGTIDQDSFRVENVHFQSRPGLCVTGNLYLPKGLAKPAPAMLYVCGHAAVVTNQVSFGFSC